MVENKNFLINNVPDLHPLSSDRITWWKEQKRRCIEGHWVGGKWMPPNLYFYINFWHIMLNKNPHSKSKIKAKPFLRDLEWEKSKIFQEARGFSGFSEDKNSTCDITYEGREMLRDLKEDRIIEYSEDIHDTIVNNSRRYNVYKYIPAREYLNAIHPGNMGKPLYINPAKNVMDIESRGTGKSYFAASNIGWYFLMDGSTDYEVDNDTMSETLVGAIDAAYSSDLLTKVRFGLDELEGGTRYRESYYPPPFSKLFRGTWDSGKKPIEARYDIKMAGGGWKTKGTGSLIHHRTFKHNPVAGNGTRPGLTYLEEVGFFDILPSALGSLEYVTMDDGRRRGTIWCMGTGGDMEGGSTEAAKAIFNDPDSYDCLVFTDEWENTGSIGYFVPATKALNEFKDSEGITNEEAAKEYLNIIRAKKKSMATKKPYNDELQNRPLVPSEAFLDTNSNIFPIGDMKEYLGYLKSIDTPEVNGIAGELIIGVDKDVKFEPDIDNNLEPAGYPVDSEANAEGCVVIWDFPPSPEELLDAFGSTVIPHGMFIGSTDTYDQDNAPNSTSLGSTFIMQCYDLSDTPIYKVVAEYTGRPATASEHHEIVRRLCMFYGALDLYENEKNSMKFHFESKGSLYLLKNTPDILKATENTTVNRGFGIHMTKSIKRELEIMLRDFLVEEGVDGRPQYMGIKSKPALSELINYNDKGNFDRVISLMLLILHKNQNYRLRIEGARQKEVDKALGNFFNRKLFTNNNSSWEVA